jgi:hypothetical protein
MGTERPRPELELAQQATRPKNEEEGRSMDDFILYFITLE